MNMPPGFPLRPCDRFDEPVAVGNVVRILTVTSCLKGMSEAERAQLRSCVGETRTIAAIDPHGFLWFAFGGAEGDVDFSLFPGEVSRTLDWSGRSKG
ncbi:MAG TPA: hypothetical protein VII36_09530 [Usitatibacter sp.]|jgi:hypothetical protein